MNKRFFNQQNLTRRLRLLSVLFAMLLMPLGAWAQTITVAGHSPAEGGAIEGDGITGTVTFDAGTNTLTLDNATIIPANDNNGIYYSGTGALTISLKGSNTISCSGVGIIQYSGTSAPTLAFTKGGTEPCSLQLGTIGVDLQTIGGFEDVSCATGLYRIDDTTGGDAGTTYKTTITSLGGGSGTSSDPIIIKTAEDLRDFAKLVNKGTITNEYIKLNPEGGELDCNGLTGFEPIGILINSSYNYPFIGKFDGNNCTIKNLTYSTTGTGDRVGLFGYVGKEGVSDTKIEKLTLSSCSFNGGEYAGGIVGELKNGTIENCVLSSCTVKSGNAHVPYAGGIAGYVRNGTISTCTFNSGLVDCTTTYSGEPSNGVHAGGIVGAIETENSDIDVTVSSCIVSSTNVKGVHSGAVNGPYKIYVGGLVGHSLGTVKISDNKVTTTDNTKKISCQSGVDYTEYLCGAIIGDKGDATLSNNTYEYDVTTEIAGTSKSGYTQRGVGGRVYNTDTQQYDPIPDVFTNNGAVMDTRLLAMPGKSSPVTALGDDGGYYAYATGTTYGILGAPGKPVKITIDPNGNTITDVSVTYGTSQTATITKTKTEEGISFYTISEMPDADDATLNVTCDIAYDLWIGETQVTDANKDHILGEGNETVTFSVTGTAAVINTLTLKGATLTVPIKVGLSNLTIDIQGTNTITTSETCIQKIDNTNPSVTFNSTSDEVGSLSLKGSSGVYGVGYGTFTISDKFAVIMKNYDRYYSYQYYFTDGSTTEALLTPSYGITVGDMQIGEGNAADVTGYGIGDGSVTASGMVSFNKSTNTLTLNKATIGVGYNNNYPITSNLPNLIIKLIGDNTATVDNQHPFFVRYDGTENTPQLTFLPSDRKVTENDGVLSASFGKLTVNGIAEIGSLASGYTFAEDIQGEINTSYTGNSSWSATVNSSTLTLSYVEAYGVWYGNNRIISTSLGAGVSGAPYFNPETNTILLNADFNSGPINSRLDELTVQVNGVVSLNSASASPAIQYTGEGGGKLKFTCVSETTPTSLTLNANNTGAAAEYKAIEGFSSDNITFTAPMKLASPSSSELLTATTVKVANCDFYGLTVAGTEVTSLNKSNILEGTANDGKVSYNDGTLTLNGASITGTIFVYEGPLNVSLSGNNILNGDNETDYAFVTEVGGALNFITDASNPGQLLMKGYTEAYVQNNLTASYLNGLGYTWEGSAFAIATLPTMTPESGVYWTDTKFTISGNEGATLGYTGDGETFTAYTAPFTLALGSQTLFPYSEVTDGTNTVHVRPADGQIYYIYNKLGFSVAAGTYNETQNITLTNLPESLPEGADAYPQVWYFLGDDDNDDSNDIRITSATQTIEVNESTKVSVYILDGDSSKKKKSEVVEAEYVIRQDPNLQFVQGETAVTAAEYTIGGTDNPALPTLKNTNEVAVTYESSDPAVATVDTDGTVTPVGVGTTTITASCVQSETLLADEASYTLTVKRQLDVSFSTSNEWATYCGTENLAMPEGLKAYQVTAVDGSTVTIGEIGYIPANTAVLLKNVSNNNTWSNIAASAYTGATSTFASNKLIGTAEAVNVSDISGGTVYVLYNNMFKRATGGTIPANRGYLVVEPSAVNAGNAPQLSISIGDENTTAISNTDFTDNTDKAGEWYSIDGVKLNGQPQKPGLYIKNGKKVFIKKK